MPPKGAKAATKAASSDSRPVNSRWVRCPRSPCLVSFNPRSAARHASACRYFRCSNQYCNYLGTQSQVNDHESGCPHSLPSEEIGTTDPLSELSSEVLDILTSPNRFNSYPTDLSSVYCSESSPRKCPSSKPSQSFEPARSRPSKLSLAPSKSTQLLPIPSTSNPSKSNNPNPRRILDPYDPSSQRVFSLPLESINPNLRPAPAPASKSSSPAPPPPPTRRLNTYELQRYCPEPQSTQAASSKRSTKRSSPTNDECATALAHTTALYESLKKCYQSLLYTYDDCMYTVSQNVIQPEILPEIVGPSIEDFRQAYSYFLADEIPDLSFLDQLDCNATEEGLDNPVSDATDSQQRSEPLAEADLTADQLADQVRLKIAEVKRRSPPEMDSPGNIFSRKRQRNESSLRQPASSPVPQRPTSFMRKLADTTWELTDEIQVNLPPCCNFKKVLDDAQHKIEKKKVKSRKSH